MPKGPQGTKMMFTIEFFRMETGRVEPVVIDRVNGEFRTLEEADAQAVVIFATVQTAKGVHGYRIIENGSKIVRYGPTSIYP